MDPRVVAGGEAMARELGLSVDALVTVVEQRLAEYAGECDDLHEPSFITGYVAGLHDIIREMQRKG